jgi:uncharacterized protein (DUF362 family)
MKISSVKVGILQCTSYQSNTIDDCVRRIADAVSFRLPRGSRVLIKPNLVAGRGHDGLACTHPECVASVARWCLDQGVVVSIGDSPAFGNGIDVMRRLGIAEAVKSLDVKLVSFSPGEKMNLPGGSSVVVAAQVLENDFLINVPKFKAHSQLGVTLAVKNYFGMVVGWRKAVLHQVLGADKTRFSEMIVDLLTVAPPGMTIMDGVTAMHKSGPLDGEKYPLGILAGSLNPVALETALLNIIRVETDKSILWLECKRRKLPGCNADLLDYPFLHSDAVRVADFSVPEVLTPIRFNGLQVLRSLRQRVKTVLTSTHNS